MFTVSQQLQAVLNWAESNEADFDEDQIYYLIGYYENYGKLSSDQIETLDIIIEKYNIQLEDYLE